MKDALLQTKLQRPPIAPDIVPRKRLWARLEEGRHLPLTLISAPAGYGKSTLASRWVASDDSPFGWVSLDESDNDPRQFLAYLLAAIKKIFPKIQLKSASFLEADRLPPEAELARYLLNDLNQVPEPFTLVLDDYHCITQTAVNDLMAGLMTYPSQAMRLILLTRKDPSLPIATLRGRGLVTEIRISDLMFTPDEAAAFLHGMLGIDIDMETATLLDEKTEGWAVGLRLAGLYLRGDKNPKARVRELSGRSSFIADYLFAEVLSRQNPDLVAYLLEASILDRFCAPLCDQMHQAEHNQEKSETEAGAETFIQWLKESSLFSIALDDEDYWFRFHHLFRDFLLGMLRKQNSTGRIQNLHRFAGKWFAENDLIEEATRHLLAAGESSEAIQLVLSRRHGMMNTGQFARLDRWLAAFPEDTLAREPLMMTTRALVGADMGRNIDIHAFTEKANRMLASLSPQSERFLELKGEVLVLQSLLELIGHDAKSALSRVCEALDCLPDDDLVARTFGILTLSICHQMAGNSKQAAAVINDAVSSQSVQVNIRARMQACLCYVYYLDANPGKVEKAAQKSLQTIGDLPFFHTRAYAGYFHGVALYLQNKLEPAESRLRTIFDDPYSANPTYLANTGFILARIYLSYGEESMAEKVLAQLGTHCRENAHARAMDLIRAFEAEFAYRCGDMNKATRISRHIDFDVNQPRWFFYVPQLTQIKCLLAEGTKQGYKEAHTRLTDLDEQMRRINRINVRIETLTLLAIVYKKQKKYSEARQRLLSALELACPGNWIRSFLDAGPAVALLLQQLVLEVDGELQAFVQKILHAFSLEIEKSPPPLQPSLRTTALQSPLLATLTEREKELLPLLAQGLSNKQIAARLFVSDLTVKTHLQNIYIKLGVKGRIEAVHKSGFLHVAPKSH